MSARRDLFAPVDKVASARGALGRFAFAVAIVAVTVAIKAVPGLAIGRERPFLLLTAAIILAAWYGGRGPAVVAMTLAVAAADYLFLPPYLSFALTPASSAQLGVFVIEGSAACAITVAAREAQARAQQARADVDQQRRRFESVLMQAPVAVGVHTGPDHVLRLANPRWFALGKTIKDPLGKPLREVLPEAVEQGVVALFDEACAAGEPLEVTEFPLRFRREGGAVETRFYNVAFQPLHEPGGAVTDVVVVISDITEQVAARHALEEARTAAEQASRAKDEFLRIASHELRTPLTPIMGWAQILKKHKCRDPVELERGLDVILASARAEARLVEDLIDVTRIIAGKMVMEMHPVDVGPLVQGCVDEIQPSAAAKGVELEASIAPGVRIMGDAARLHQVASKLLSNALKFTPSGGRISVELAAERGSVMLRVRDTGKGIGERELARMFGPFQPGDSSTTRTEGGLGLGLTIVQHIVQAHGGSVRAESEGLGRGTTFLADLGQAI